MSLKNVFSSPTESGQKIQLSLTTDEINLLRECMKRTEDYYRGLLLLKQDWNADKNEQAIAIIKVNSFQSFNLLCIK